MAGMIQGCGFPHLINHGRGIIRVESIGFVFSENRLPCYVHINATRVGGTFDNPAVVFAHV